LARDRLGERRADLVAQARRALAGHAVGARERVQAGAVQRLVDVDVAKAGEERLVEQQRLEAAAAPAHRRLEPGGGETGAERLGPELAEQLARLLRPPQPTELAHVDEMEDVAVVEREAHLAELAGIPARGFDVHASGHPQVTDERAGRAAIPLEVGDDELAAPPHARDASADDRARERGARETAERARPAHVAALDAPSLEARTEQARDGLDLGELGHADDPTPAGEPRPLRCRRRSRTRRRPTRPSCTAA